MFFLSVCTCCVLPSGDITDVVTHTNFGGHRLKGFGETGVKFPPSQWLSSSSLQHCRTTVRACDGHTINKSVFGFLRQLTTWHCSHLLLSAVLLGALRPHLTIDIAYSPGARQQTRRTLLQRANGTDRQTPYRYIDPAAYSAASDDADKQMTIDR